MKVVTISLLCGILTPSWCLDNGLALTPPMGWLSWLRFMCTVDCENKPRECLSEDLIIRTTDKMVADGYRDAGYDTVIIDDCWLEMNRSADGKMVPDMKRFKSGMKSLSDYVHKKNMKFGMYQDIGTLTCAGYPGEMGHEEVDIKTFVEWEIDYLKVDGCNIYIDEMDAAYPAYGKLLNATGRPILYSCSWPAYQEGSKMKVNYSAISENCNIWRNYGDIDRSWSSVSGIMDWFGDNQDRLAPFAAPGHWNDPDMLVVGNKGLTVDQAKVQMAVWSVMAAPLIMSVDLDEIEQEFKDILLNKDVIAVDQDKLGKQGLRVYKNDGLEIWNRELSLGHALAFVNQNSTPSSAEFTFEEMGLPDSRYEVQDLYKEDETRTLEPHTRLKVDINPTGVKFYKFLEIRKTNYNI